MSFLLGFACGTIAYWITLVVILFVRQRGLRRRPSLRPLRCPRCGTPATAVQIRLGRFECPDCGAYCTRPELRLSRPQKPPPPPAPPRARAG